MSELKEIIETVEKLWQANSFNSQIKSIKSESPEWYESTTDKCLIFSLMGHQEFFSAELIKLKRAIEQLEKEPNK